MDEIEVGRAFIVCDCNERHRLFRGIAALCYWCADELKEIKVGDYVDIPDLEGEI